MKTIIRMPEVERLTTLSGSEIYKRMNAGKFPRSIKLGNRAVGWVKEEVDAYVAATIAARDSGNQRKETR